MITLSILKQMQDDNIGTIDNDLFFEEAAIDNKGNPKPGVWIVSRDTAVTRFNTQIQAFDLYVRYTNKLVGIQKAHELLEYLQESFEDVCSLPSYPPYTTKAYDSVVIVPTSGVESLGSDEQDRMVFVISGEVRYAKTV